jgi:hypothetical protein
MKNKKQMIGCSINKTVERLEYENKKLREAIALAAHFTATDSEGGPDYPFSHTLCYKILEGKGII